MRSQNTAADIVVMCTQEAGTALNEEQSLRVAAYSAYIHMPINTKYMRQAKVRGHSCQAGWNYPAEVIERKRLSFFFLASRRCFLIDHYIRIRLFRETRVMVLAGCRDFQPRFARLARNMQARRTPPCGEPAAAVRWHYCNVSRFSSPFLAPSPIRIDEVCQAG